ncbi:MAG TPA: hypothetical protein VD838_04840, partial [Anaeromyxobacteraceae bacterium]|nr:hypothetical protein [Anaeromyxobacteraceae bacterium]
GREREGDGVVATVSMTCVAAGRVVARAVAEVRVVGRRIVAMNAARFLARSASGSTRVVLRVNVPAPMSPSRRVDDAAVGF